MGWFTSESKQVVDNAGQKVNNIVIQDSSTNLVLTLIAIICVVKVIELVIHLYNQNTSYIISKAQKPKSARSTEGSV